MKKLLIAVIAITITFSSYPCNAFTRITYIVDKEGLNADSELSNTEVRKLLEKKKLRILEAKRLKAKKGLDIYVNATVPTDDDSIQLPLSVGAFLSAIGDAVDLWNGIEVSNLSINEPLLSTLNADPQDGNYVITGNPNEAIEGVPDLTPWYVVVNIATKSKVEIDGKNRKVKPGTIVDVDVIFNPSISDCVAHFTSAGTIQTGGDPAALIASGGFDGAKALLNCSSDGLTIDLASLDDITDSAIKGIGRMFGLETSALTTSALGRVGQNMVRYSLTQDEEIGLANIYPSKKNLGTRGSVYGRVRLKKRPVVGAHVILQDSSTGEVVASTISDIRGHYSIMAVPDGDYIVIAEPLDGSTRPKTFLSYFNKRAEIDFTTTSSDKIVTINKNNRKMVNIKVASTGAALNINPKAYGIKTDALLTASGGNALYLVCSPGQTLDDVEFWGSNIDTSIGTLSVSGSDVTVTDVMNASVAISDLTGAEVYPGFTADINCLGGAKSGMRNIIFTADLLPANDPNFNLQDQIAGGLIVRE